MGQPISGAHAIEAVSFVLAFERPFSAASLEALTGLQQTLQDDLPVFQKINAVEFRVDVGGPPTQNVGVTTGALFQRFRPDGGLAWILRVDGNAIVATCHQYEDWSPVCRTALHFIKSVAKVVAEDPNPLGLVALQVVDRFVAPSSDDYDYKNVFSAKSRYLTSNVARVGRLWHVHQGWFDENAFGIDGRCLNVVNIGTNDTPSGLITTIDHLAQAQASAGWPAGNAVDVEWLGEVFQSLHEKNKEVIRDLINAKQRKAVKL